MTPKEKAKELVDKFTNLYEGINLGLAKKHWAKQSALLAVDEILNTLKIFPEKDTTSKSVVNFSISRIVYWVQVKKEIEAL
jgi:hypothetical protein